MTVGGETVDAVRVAVQENPAEGRVAVRDASAVVAGGCAVEAIVVVGVVVAGDVLVPAVDEAVADDGV